MTEFKTTAATATTALAASAGPKAMLEAGAAASRANDSANAIACWTKASEEFPALAMPHFLIGSEYASAGQVDNAEAAFANAVLLEPEFYLARYQLGLLQFSAGRTAVALMTWQPMLNSNGPVSLCQYVLGFSALAAGDLPLARSHFEAGLAGGEQNAAVNADIRRVVAGLDGMVQTQGVAARQPPATAEQPAHVLLSNYGRYGRH